MTFRIVEVGSQNEPRFPVLASPGNMFVFFVGFYHRPECKEFCFKHGQKYEDNNEFVLDEREARETFPNENSDFNDVGKTDGDLFFALEDDTKWKNKKR